MRFIMLLSIILVLPAVSSPAQSVRTVVDSNIDNGDGIEWTYQFSEYCRLHNKYLNDKIPSVLDDLTTLYLADASLHVGNRSVIGRANIKQDLSDYMSGLLKRQRTGRSYQEDRSVVQVALASETEVVCLIETTGYHYQTTRFVARSSRYDLVAITKQKSKWGIAVEVLGAVEPTLLSSESGGLKAIARMELLEMYRQFNRTSRQSDGD